MATTPAQIDLWIQARTEHQRLEFKEAKNQYDNTKLYRYCVAMAEKLFAAVGFRVDIDEVAHPDGRVVVFHIPSRPHGTAYHLDGAYLLLAAATDAGLIVADEGTGGSKRLARYLPHWA